MGHVGRGEHSERTFLAKVKLVADDGAKLTLCGNSVGDQIKPARPVVLAASEGDVLCTSSTPDGAFAGKIVVCKRGVIPILEKSFNVAQRKAAGMLLYEDPAIASPFGPTPLTHSIPTIHLESDAGTALVDFLTDHPGAEAIFTKGASKGRQGDVIGAFSSRGGSNLAFGVSKPDLAAPGVDILAGDTPEHWNPHKIDGESLQVASGTSAATPHVAAAGALLKQLHPDWTPGRIQSALMRTARATKVFKEDGTTPFDAFDAGSGPIDLKKARDPGITFDVPVEDYVDHAGDLWSVNYPSLFLPVSSPSMVTVGRIARSELAEDATWELAVDSPSDLIVTVPAEVSIAPGDTASFMISVDKSAVPAGEVRFATLELSTKGHVARFPITAVGTKPLPDLIATDVQASRPVMLGGAITISVTIQNVGGVTAGVSGTWLNLSTDATLSADDPFLGFSFCAILALAPGATFTCSGTIPFQPLGPAPPGEYRVFGSADVEGQVTESDESNNGLATPGTITVN